VEKSYQITIFKAFTTSPRGGGFSLEYGFLLSGVSGCGLTAPGWLGSLPGLGKRP
jgi:hypothetical protein